MRAARWTARPIKPAAVSDASHPSWRARSLSVYRFWRDMGYVVGGLVAGLGADALDYSGAIVIVAGLTAASGLWVAIDLPTPRSASAISGAEPAAARVAAGATRYR